MATVELVQLDASAINELLAISIQTFVETFAPVNTAESMAQYVTEKLTKEKLLAELNCVDSAFYFVKVDSEIAGYLKLNFNEAQSELKEAQGLEIERIYVLQAFQGQKLGLFLIDQAIELAKSQGKAYVWLGVWEHNEKAIQFYQKRGFVQFGSHEFMLGDELQLDLMMKLELGEDRK